MKKPLKIAALLSAVIILLTVCFACEPPDGDTQTGTGIFAELVISCATVLDNMDSLKSELIDFVPPDGIILARGQFEIKEKETILAFAVRICRAKGIPLITSGGYISGIGNISEKSVGLDSGWLVKRNGEFLKVGAGGVYVRGGDFVEFGYTCQIGDTGYGYS
ncbi:MAG: DUF4430 domain-containing protein [Clostridiales bacterium]|jgi:hypothetical protein|nr:DUF4430 domain-containing protein [Clostridiales bacterium]